MDKNANHYDYFVIGAGSGGVRSARIAAQYGAKVGVAENSKLGGTCVNLGCVPKKLLAYGADYGAHFEDAKGYGWDVGTRPAFNWGALIKNKNTEIDRLNGIYKNLLDNAGVDIVTGTAQFIDKNSIDVDGQVITADKFLIAVGGRPRRKNIEGGDLMATSDDVFFWPSMPKHVVIEGGGYIGVEFAHIFHGLGAKVTLIHRGDLLLRGFDDTIRHALVEEMVKQGIDIRFKCEVEKVEQSDDAYVVHLDNGDCISCDLPMSAIGRIPNTEQLSLDNAGVEIEKGYITVNEQYETSTPHIFAIGDVTSTPQLTPVAIREGHVLADRLYGQKPKSSVNYNFIATAVFSQPPIGAVGMTEHEVLDKGHEIMRYVSNFKPMKHTLTGRDERSVMKLIVDFKTERVLGLHMMGLDAPEIVQGFAVAMNMGATKADFDRTMAMHPTSAEEFVTMRSGEHIKPKAQ